MTTPYISEIRLMAFNFQPRGWFQCNGQLLPISQYQPLFALIGTTYGGNGVTNFQLPDLRGLVPLHFGLGPAGNVYSLGQTGGKPGVSLTSDQIAAHSHTLRGKSANADTDAAGVTPSPTVALAQPLASKSTGGTTPVNIYSQSPKGPQMLPAAIGSEGGSQPHENRQPFQVVNFCIAYQGIFPSPT